MKEYYIYEWIRLDLNEPFYVGKGKDNRCFDTDRRNKHFGDIINYCNKNKIEIAVYKIEENLNEEEAFKGECLYIHEYVFEWGFNLSNKIWGGEGGDVVSMMSPQQKLDYSKKMSESLKGKNTGPRSEEIKKKISETKKRLCIGKGKSNPMYGKRLRDYMSEEAYNNWKQNISNSMKGRIVSEETRKKLSKSLKGKIRSPELKEYLREINIGKRNPMYGRKHTDRAKELIAKGNEKKVAVEFKDKSVMYFDSRNKCAKYFQENYDVGIYSIKNLLRTGENLNSKYKKFQGLNGLKIYYIK